MATHRVNDSKNEIYVSMVVSFDCEIWSLLSSSTPPPCSLFQLNLLHKQLSLSLARSLSSTPDLASLATPDTTPRLSSRRP